MKLFCSKFFGLQYVNFLALAIMLACERPSYSRIWPAHISAQNKNYGIHWDNYVIHS